PSEKDRSLQTIELDGSLLRRESGYNGLVFTIKTKPGGAIDTTADGSWVYGLTIDRFPADGIDLSSVKNVTIGAEETGSIHGGRMIINRNGRHGVHFEGSRGSDNLVKASFIGTDAASNIFDDFGKPLGNAKGGVYRVSTTSALRLSPRTTA